MRRDDKRAIPSSLEQCREERLDDGSVEVPFRLVDQHHRSGLNRKNSGRDDGCVPLPVRQLCDTERCTTWMASEYLLVFGALESNRQRPES